MFGAEDTVGIAASIRALRLGAEHSVGSVDRYAFEVAFGSREERDHPLPPMRLLTNSPPK